MTRHLTPAAMTNKDAIAALGVLSDESSSVLEYGAAFKQLGLLLGRELLTQVDLRDRRVCLGFTVEDADYLAEGMLEALEEVEADVRLACFWNRRSQPFNLNWLDIATIVQEYVDPDLKQIDHLIILKSIVSGTCVVRTNLMRLLEITSPSMIHVISPVSLEGAEDRLAQEFPHEVSSHFRYLTFAVDSSKTDDGIVVPGIGGEVYERLGMGDRWAKNARIPEMIRRRQRDLFDVGQNHTPSP